MKPPLSPIEVRGIQPRLIYIEDSFAIGEKFDDLHGKLLPQYQVFLRVTVKRDLLDRLILHA